MKAEKVPVLWAKKNRFLDLKAVVKSFVFVDAQTLKMALSWEKEGTMRPEEALDLIFGWRTKEQPGITIQKLKVQFKESGLCPVKS